jgi:membrane protein
LTWGAGAASLLWIAGSILFSYYVSSFGNYEKTYGSLGAIVVFLLWLMLSAFAVLFGAELNAEMERQTERDTTTGKPLPRGERGAYAADTLGPARPKSKRRRKEEPERKEDHERGHPSGARPSRRSG